MLPPRSNGDACSAAAAASIAGDVEKLRREVWKFVREAGPTTCDEAEAALGLSHQTCSPRFKELRDCGALYRTGEKRATRTGRKAWVHEASRIEPI